MLEKKKFKTKLLAKHDIAGDTWAFVFEKPVGYTFIPGQNIDLELPSGISDQGLEDSVHTFSISSSLQDQHIRIVTRIRSTSYKAKLSALELGQEVTITEAKGKFTINDKVDLKEIVFLVGGIGITPVLSIVNSDYSLENLKHLQKVLILWSNFDTSTTPFYQITHDKFGRMAHTSGQRQFHFMYTFTGEQTSSDDYFSGRINEAMLNSAFREFFGKKFVGRQWGVRAGLQFYLVGKSEFVKSMQKLLSENGVPKEFVIKDVFGGY